MTLWTFCFVTSTFCASAVNKEPLIRHKSELNHSTTKQMPQRYIAQQVTGSIDLHCVTMNKNMHKTSTSTIIDRWLFKKCKRSGFGHNFVLNRTPFLLWHTMCTVIAKHVMKDFYAHDRQSWFARFQAVWRYFNRNSNSTNTVKNKDGGEVSFLVACTL